MSPKRQSDSIVASWTNGRKALVYQMRRADGTNYILKKYRSRFYLTMLREWLTTRYLQSRINVVPQVLFVRPTHATLALSFISGERALEWVLKRFGPANLDLSAFASFHGMGTNETVSSAFASFYESRLSEAEAFRAAIRRSYKLLHQAGWIHGSADPRNLIYDGKEVYIIDFDHARPATKPVRTDGAAVKRWFQIDLNET